MLSKLCDEYVIALLQLGICLVYSLNQRTFIFLEELQALSQNFVYVIELCYYTHLLLCILFRHQFFFHINDLYNCLPVLQ